MTFPSGEIKENEKIAGYYDIEVLLKVNGTEIGKISELEKKMSTILAHKAELKELEENFRNNEKEASIPLQSYECGFLRGIATIALGNTGRTTTNPEIEIPESINMTATA